MLIHSHYVTETETLSKYSINNTKLCCFCCSLDAIGKDQQLA